MTSQTGDRVPWRPGQLWSRLQAQTRHGIATNELAPIETRLAVVEEGNIPFRVYILKSLARKEKALKQQGKTAPANPFLPYEPDLYVCDISETHLCLLNKFNVVDHHFLIVTRAFEPQEDWLTLADFDALSQCFGELDGLAFYNGGPVAGASQPHRHLQVIPQVEVGPFPMDAVIVQAVGTASKVDVLPFRHAIAPTPSPSDPSDHWLDTYHQLLRQVDIQPDHASLPNLESSENRSAWHGPQTAPYNLLCTRQWMMVVPRTQEKHADISVNSLGFAGSLLVKTPDKLDKLKSIGPMQLLKKVGYALR